MKATAKRADCSEKRLSSPPMELAVARKVRVRYLEYRRRLVSTEGKKLSVVISSVQQPRWARTGRAARLCFGEGGGNSEAEGREHA